MERVEQFQFPLINWRVATSYCEFRVVGVFHIDIFLYRHDVRFSKICCITLLWNLPDLFQWWSNTDSWKKTFKRLTLQKKNRKDIVIDFENEKIYTSDFQVHFFGLWWICCNFTGICPSIPRLGMSYIQIPVP